MKAFVFNTRREFTLFQYLMEHCREQIRDEMMSARRETIAANDNPSKLGMEEAGEFVYDADDKRTTDEKICARLANMLKIIAGNQVNRDLTKTIMLPDGVTLRPNSSDGVNVLAMEGRGHQSLFGKWILEELDSLDFNRIAAAVYLGVEPADLSEINNEPEGT